MGPAITDHRSQQKEILSKSQACQVVLGQGVSAGTKICVPGLCLCPSKTTARHAAPAQAGRPPPRERPERIQTPWGWEREGTAWLLRGTSAPAAGVSWQGGRAGGIRGACRRGELT